MTLLQKIEELEKLANAATPGPWYVVDRGQIIISGEGANFKGAPLVLDADYISEADSRFTSAARTAIPELCQALREMVDFVYSIAKDKVFLPNEQTEARDLLAKYGIEVKG